ncbi:hypothetical protein PHEL85_0099 [Polaribacter sp. Hel1_85]|nr:hypothetical protein PHEL85_0099 [Polaribacter sp. Hel1_85]
MIALKKSQKIVTKVLTFTLIINSRFHENDNFNGFLLKS